MSNELENLKQLVLDLREQLKEYEDERIGNAEISLGLACVNIPPAVYAAVVGRRGRFGKVNTKPGTAKAEATSYDNASGSIAEFRLFPIRLITKVNGKWPRVKKGQKA